MAKGDIESWSGFCSWLYSLFGSNPPSNEAMVRHAAVGPGDRILDIGCGPGASLEHAHAAGAEVFGVDPTPGMVKRAVRRVPAATVVQGSAEHLDFDDGFFTHVWSVASYHHWAYPERAFDEIRRVLQPGGRLFVMESLIKDGKKGHGLNRGDADDLAATLADHGFTDGNVDVIRAGRKEYVVVSTSV
jgi:ubiquinone/menaquinone biosynthesis C-methylase UbiE